MRLESSHLFCLPFFSLVLFAVPQQPPVAIPRDPQALAVFQQAIIAMGGSVPSDSTATGTITTVAGSLTETGAIVIRTRGTDQTVEDIQTPHGSRLTYSRGEAGRFTAALSTSLQLELAVTAQCPDFPLPLLASILTRPDMAYRYVGLETSAGGSSLHHLQFWNSFASNPRLQSLAALSVRDVWIDASSGLPQRISYSLRPAQGAEAAVPMDVFYSDYRNVGGVLYPFSIQKSWNGTPWATIRISSVSFNGGLADSDFAVQ
jgi:hypothetical protein